MAAHRIPARDDIRQAPGAVRLGTDGARAVVWLSGEHDISTRDAVVAALDEAAGSGADVVVDLAEAGFLDAASLGALVRAHERLAVHDRRLTLRGLEGLPRRLVDTCGLAWLVEEAPTSADGRAGRRAGQLER